MTTEKPSLTTALYHCAASDTAAYILEGVEERLPDARVYSLRASKVRRLEHGDRRAAGGRA